jgi:hypothetical protein
LYCLLFFFWLKLYNYKKCTTLKELV